MGRRERLGYAVAMARGELRGGDRRWWAYGSGDGAREVVVAAPAWPARLRDAQRTFRAALAAARDAG